MHGLKHWALHSFFFFIIWGPYLMSKNRSSYLDISSCKCITIFGNYTFFCCPLNLVSNWVISISHFSMIFIWLVLYSNIKKRTNGEFLFPTFKGLKPSNYVYRIGRRKITQIAEVTFPVFRILRTAYSLHEPARHPLFFISIASST